jgi:hypothetical protein
MQTPCGDASVTNGTEKNMLTCFLVASFFASTLSCCKRICCQTWGLVRQGGASCIPTNAHTEPEEIAPEVDFDESEADVGGNEER